MNRLQQEYPWNDGDQYADKKPDEKFPVIGNAAHEMQVLPCYPEYGNR